MRKTNRTLAATSEDRGWQIDTLVVVRRPTLKKQWTPSTKHVGQQTFFKLSRLQVHNLASYNTILLSGSSHFLWGREASFCSSCKRLVELCVAGSLSSTDQLVPALIRHAICWREALQPLSRPLCIHDPSGKKQLDSNIWLELTTGCLETLQALMKPCVNEHQAEAAASDVQGEEPGAKVKKRKL